MKNLDQKIEMSFELIEIYSYFVLTHHIRYFLSSEE